MTKSRKQVLTDAYTKLHAEVSAVLYDEDPEGMGVTTGSPDDEYSGEATKLILHLQKRGDHENVAAAVREMYIRQVEERLHDGGPSVRSYRPAQDPDWTCYPAEGKCGPPSGSTVPEGDQLAGP